MTLASRLVAIAKSSGAKGEGIGEGVVGENRAGGTLCRMGGDASYRRLVEPVGHAAGAAGREVVEPVFEPGAGHRVSVGCGLGLRLRRSRRVSVLRARRDSNP